MELFILALLAAAAAADQGESALDAAQKKLSLVKERHTRMLLRLHGAELTGATGQEEKSK